MLAIVRSDAGPDVELSEQAQRIATRNPGVLCPRIHVVEPALGPRGRAGKYCLATTLENRHKASRTRFAHRTVDHGRRARNQPLLAPTARKGCRFSSDICQCNTGFGRRGVRLSARMEEQL